MAETTKGLQMQTPNPNNKDTKTAADGKRSTEQNIIDAVNSASAEMAAKRYSVKGCEGKPMGEWVKHALTQPPKRPLFENYWYEGKVACLFSDTNVGKSILATQIAVDVCRNHPHDTLLYFDFELDEDDLADRYTDGKRGNPYDFPANLIREQLTDEVVADGKNTLAIIEKLLDKAGAHFAIVDNLTWICTDAEKGETAGKFMQTLKQMAKKYSVSLLVIAHTPKIDKSTLSVNALAGSKKLANFFDSIFAMGFVSGNDDERYIKLLKGRKEKVDRSGKVRVYKLWKPSNFLHFEYVRDDYETNLVPADDKAEKMAQVKKLREQGHSYRQIENETGIGRSTAHRWANS